jgi:hypothetical protein
MTSENILFGLPLDMIRYRTVLFVSAPGCRLVSDLKLAGLWLDA